MRIKKILRNKEELFDFAWEFINIDNKEVWKPEDKKIIQPFFDYSNYSNGRPERKMNEAECAAFDHYTKCREEYADRAFEIRDAVKQIDPETLYSFFLLEPPIMECWDFDENGNDIDEQGNIIPPESREGLRLIEDLVEEVSFPLCLVGVLISDSDRLGNIAMCFSQIVTLKDFEDD